MICSRKRFCFATQLIHSTQIIITILMRYSKINICTFPSLLHSHCLLWDCVFFLVSFQLQTSPMEMKSDTKTQFSTRNCLFYLCFPRIIIDIYCKRKKTIHSVHSVSLKSSTLVFFFWGFNSFCLAHTPLNWCVYMLLISVATNVSLRSKHNQPTRTLNWNWLTDKRHTASQEWWVYGWRLRTALTNSPMRSSFDEWMRNAKSGVRVELQQPRNAGGWCVFRWLNFGIWKWL